MKLIAKSMFVGAISMPVPASFFKIMDEAGAITE